MVTISDLLNDLEEIILKSSKFLSCDENELQKQPALKKWSAIQTLDHLNMTFSQYQPIISYALEKSYHLAGNTGEIKYSILGKFFIHLAGPQSKIKIPSHKIFKPKLEIEMNREDVVAQFISNQREIQDFLIQAKMSKINHMKFSSPISPMIRFRLGEIFALLVRHEQRHLFSIESFLNIT